MTTKKRSIAILLLFLFGAFGVHRFYLGRWVGGLLMMASLFLFWPLAACWVVYDFVMLIMNRLTTSDGEVLL